MDERDSSLEYIFADIVIDKPYVFTVGRKQMRLYPLTLAKTFVLRPLIESLHINADVLRLDPHVEALRLACTQKETCCRILAIYATPNTQNDLFDYQQIGHRHKKLARLESKGIATLLEYVLKSDRTELLMGYLGLSKEHEKLARISEVKKSKNSVTVGGKTVLGAFVGQLKEMGYSDREIVFERGYYYLRLLLADKMTSVYLSDEELGKLPAEVGGTMLNGDDPASAKKIEEMFARRGVKIEK